MIPDASRLPISKGWTIRPLADGDRATLLRLNAGNSPVVCHVKRLREVIDGDVNLNTSDPLLCNLRSCQCPHQGAGSVLVRELET